MSINYPTDAVEGADEPASLYKDRERIQTPEGASSQIIYSYLIPFLLFHAMIPLCFIPYFFSWTGLLLIPIAHFFFDWVGIGLCYHRTLTHGGLVVPKWLEHIFVVLGMCNLMDSPARWVAIHRKHHQHTDERPDPHTPLVSFFWGHMGWLIYENKTMSNIEFYNKYARDILKDPFYMKIEKYKLWALSWLVHAVLFTLAGFGIGWAWTGSWLGGIQLGASWLLWGVIMRTLFSWHTTWAVNSITHMFGYRNYETRDTSTNHWLIALLTGGEGWHNNHHAHPVSAAHGHKWWEVDPTYFNIRVLKFLGLATEVKTVLDTPASEKRDD